MDLSIIIVSWNVKEKLKNNLEKIFQIKHKIKFELFVVDNNSSDGTVDMIRENFPEVKLIENKKNYGFARANNQAIRGAKGRHILLLNPDMVIFEETLNKTVDYMDANIKIGVAGCKLVDEKGRVIRHVRLFPNWRNQLAIILKIPHIFSGVLKKYLRDDFDYNQEKEVASVRGSFFVIRREIISKIGELDERFFIWFEEVDFCRRVWDSGERVVYTPEIECVDLVGKSFFQVDTLEKQKYFRNSMLEYFNKWHPGWQYLLLKFFWPLGLLLTKISIKFGSKSKAKT
ncbi:glycosyltransferase family 2 protein [bacterium]|nr:glycosyltransferase family 2 protein [bacterium]